MKTYKNINNKKSMIKKVNKQIIKKNNNKINNNILMHYIAIQPLQIVQLYKNKANN